MNESIVNLFVNRVILGKTKFSEVPNQLKDAVEEKLVEAGLGYFTIMESEENKNG